MADTSNSETYIYWTSIVLIILIYSTAIPTYFEIKQCVHVVDFGNDFFQCRQPRLHIAYIAAFLFVLYILNPITLFLANVYGHGLRSSTIPLFISDIADILIFLTFFPRAWILWFHRALVDSLQNWVWRREINPQDADFLVRHRRYLQHFHALVYAFYAIAIAPIFGALHLPYFSIHGRLPLTCVLVLMVIVTTFIVHKISVVSDEYSIREELLRSVSITGVIYIAAHIVFDIILHADSMLTPSKWALILETAFSSLVALSVIYYTCYWTRRKFAFYQQMRYAQQLRDIGSRSSISSFGSFLGKERIRFQHIMNHRLGLEAMCNHLVEEMGLETVLFLVEVAQFKANILRQTASLPQSASGRLQDNIPDLCGAAVEESHIFSAASILSAPWLPVDARMFSFTAYEFALHLYDKYVEESASLCINISSETRREVYRYFQQLSQLNDVNTNHPQATALVNLYTVFDAAFAEIWHLVKTDCFLRFMQTEAFRRLTSVLYPAESRLAHKIVVQKVEEQIRAQIEQRGIQPLPLEEQVTESEPVAAGTTLQSVASTSMGGEAGADSNIQLVIVDTYYESNAEDPEADASVVVACTPSEVVTPSPSQETFMK